MRSAPLPTHDPTLGPIAAAHNASPPRPAALALLTTGLAAGITPTVVIAWTKSRLPHRADLIDLLTGPARPRLVAAARKHTRETSTPDGRHRLAIRHARMLVGSLFSSAAGGGGRIVGARASVAMLGK